MGRRAIIVYDTGDRASRYPVTVPIRFRPLGEIGWTEAMTINLSCSGVLFEANEPFLTDTPIEMSFELPVEFGGDSEVTCRGQVVRTMMPPATDAPPSIAATITEFRFTQK